MNRSVNQPQFFFDNALIDDQSRLTRRWLSAAIYPEPVLQADRPWENGALAFYGSIWPEPEGGGYRMYYTNWPGHTRGGGKLLLASSADGLRWDKPELGMVEFNGHYRNNIVLDPGQHLDAPSVIHDPDDPSAPWKMICFHSPTHEVFWHDDWGLYTYLSTDGLRWRAQPGPVLRAGDRTNLVPEKVDGRYVTYTRHQKMIEHTGTRAIYQCQSEDFMLWTDPQLVLRPDLGDDPDVEFYGMSVFRRYGWYLGLLEYWREQTDTIELHLAFSRDGKAWMRSEKREPLIAPTYWWNRRWNSAASTGPVLLNEQMVFYFGGRWTAHGYDSAQVHGAIGYASLPLDRFCALEARTAGQMTTIPIEWPGGELVLNADTRTCYTSHPLGCDGGIEIELLDAEGHPVQDFSGDARGRFAGNTHCRMRIQSGEVRWPQNQKLNTLKGRVLRLRFHLDHARLFTFMANTSG